MSKNKEQGNTTTALAVIGDHEYAILKTDPNKVRELIQDNLGGEVTERDIDRIKVPAGGGIAWQLPTSGDDEVAKTFAGVIIAKHPTRQYWANGIDEGGTAPPDCSAPDAITGVGVPGGNCGTCPLGQFKSDPNGGGGKACKDRMLLFIMRPDSLLPTCLQLPPTSLDGFKKYMVHMSQDCQRFNEVVTEFSLKEVPNSAGIMYSRVQFASVANLRKEQSVETRRLGDLFEKPCAQVTSQVTTQGNVMDPPEYVPDTGPGPDPEPEPVEVQ